jgi:hypothetical protein
VISPDQNRMGQAEQPDECHAYAQWHWRLRPDCLSKSDWPC